MNCRRTAGLLALLAVAAGAITGCKSSDAPAQSGSGTVSADSLKADPSKAPPDVRAKFEAAAGGAKTGPPK